MLKPRLVPQRHPMVLGMLSVVLAAVGSMGLINSSNKPVYPISLQFVGAKRDAVTRQVASGWPITLRLSSNGELGIGTPAVPPYFPRIRESGYIIFADPDNCFSFAALSTCPVRDETYLELTPDLDMPGLANPHGNWDRLIGLTDFGGGGSPQVYTFNFQTHLNDRLVSYGPIVGGPEPDLLESRCVGPFKYAGPACSSDGDCGPNSTCRLIPLNADGYGLGADDDLPGLVLLSDAGVGVVVNQDFNRPRLRQARNLAGLMSSVAYELNDASARTTVVAHLNVPEGQVYIFPLSAGGDFPARAPRGLFTPVVLEDRCLGDTTTCSQGFDRILRIDGGPQLTMTDNELFDLLNTQVVTVRAFVVNGTAPSILADLNQDGVVSSKDAALAGYALLSGEETIRIVGWYDDNLEVTPMLFDFDGNGDARGDFAAPGGAGQIKKVPR